MPSDGADPKERALVVARRLFPDARLDLEKASRPGRRLAVGVVGQTADCMMIVMDEH
jgi:hypothetical protein